MSYLLEDLMEPKDAAKAMGISLATISRCVKRGAPVHRWGSTGRCYRFRVTEFVSWMENQNPNENTPAKKAERMDVHAMGLARKLHIASLGRKEARA